MDPKPAQKNPIHRNPRACTVCRAAKMKCVGAEDGLQPCQRCKRGNFECVFEKHRRGRRPGSKLSETSKLLRRLDKVVASPPSSPAKVLDSLPHPVVHSAPSSSQAADPNFYPSPYSTSDMYVDSRPPTLPRIHHLASPDADFHNAHPSYLPSRQLDHVTPFPSPSRLPLRDDDDAPRDLPPPLPSIRPPTKETSRSSFFGTILNPPDQSSVVHSTPTRLQPHQSQNSARESSGPVAGHQSLPDPLSAGLIDDGEAAVFFDLIFLRLNPYINLFDPNLHSVSYVRSRSPFLFCTMILIACKFWKPERYQECRQLAHAFVNRAFERRWRSVEVVQAFTCLTFWTEPDDDCEWSYLGYACRMAVELGLNRPTPGSEKHAAERRNRERTYLVLFLQDRTLSMRTGKQWMLPDSEFVRNSGAWYMEGTCGPPCPEDVMICAVVELRRVVAETYELCKSRTALEHSDVNYNILLTSCNVKLTDWMEKWHNALKRASGLMFHFSLLCLYRLHTRLFLNSLGLQAVLTSNSSGFPGVQTISMCYSSAQQSLMIITKEMAPSGMLRYANDSLSIMTAYSAIFLLKLMATTAGYSEFGQDTPDRTFDLISQTADAYQEAAVLADSSSSAAHHARFLRYLLASDIWRSRTRSDQNSEIALPAHGRQSVVPANSLPGTPFVGAEGAVEVSTASISSHLSSSSPSSPGTSWSGTPRYRQNSEYDFPASPTIPTHPLERSQGGHEPRAVRGSSDKPTSPFDLRAPAPPVELTGMDAIYWRNMFCQLGFGGPAETISETS